MGLTKWLDSRSVMLAFVDVTMFFGLSAIGFYAVGRTGMPWWAWAIVAAAWLAVLVVYWAPGEEAVEQAEMQGFVWFMAVAVIAVCVLVEVRYHGISRQLEMFWRIMSTGGR